MSRLQIFKVMILGDSGVGKSTFIQRFCKNQFEVMYRATIGVDNQFRSMTIDGQSVVMQVMDTAGQVRIPNITNQFFRSADGVIVMYDVTSETSFTNVRNWMASAKERASDTVIPVLIGNKCDLPWKAVKTEIGSWLADDYGALFYETSALSGENVDNAMEALARLLKEKKDEEIEKSFKLEPEPVKKKGCCI